MKIPSLAGAGGVAMIGLRLGPYEITAKLGAGGMGEVYRATDSKLKRAVAIKVLPAAFVSDPERLARFEREAHLLAQLQHPNIASIYGLEESGGTSALVMELVDGDDLSALIARGPLPVAEAMAIARQIAEALEAAHEHGIVHRDLKPANIKVRADGLVKVLDFGLAKAMDPAAGALSAAELANSPTATFGGTRDGVILGTAAYMSPEQARGAAIDKRADIWAFGVVLYEMLTGERLFSEGSVVDTLSAVMRQPIDLAQLPSSTPRRLRELVRRCLDRDLKHRLRDIGEARVAIQDELAGPEAATDALPLAGARHDVHRTRRWTLALAALVVVAALLWLSRAIGDRTAKASGGPRAVSFIQVTDLPGVETSPTLSPDGKSLVFAGTVEGGTGLFLLRIGDRKPVRLADDSPATSEEPAFSPDGERIAFRSDREGGGIFLMTASGESVTRLTDFGFSPSWSPDGGEIVVSAGSFRMPQSLFIQARGLSVVNVKSGQRRDLTVSLQAMQPSWSPGGARIAYWGVRAGGQRDLWTIAADGSDAASGGVPVTEDEALDWSPTWSPDGKYLYFSSDRGGTMNLWRVAIDEGTGRREGEPEPVTTPSTWSGRFSFSSDGTRLAFATLDYRSVLFRAAFDARREALTGPPEPIVRSSRLMGGLDLSPSGEWVLYSEVGVWEDLFVARTDGTQYRRLTDDAFRDRGPRWSPDGTRIAFRSDRSGDYEIWTIRPDGSGLVQLTQGAGSGGPPVWSPDGARIAYGGAGPWGLIDAAATKGRLAPEPESNSGERLVPISWSPDGERIAGTVRQIDGSTAARIYTLATRQYSAVPGDWGRGTLGLFPVWLADGRRLVLRSSRGVAVADFATGAGQLLIPGDGTFAGPVAVSRDNRWITYIETATEGDIWIAELTRAEGKR
ncbi:MAG: protein kinase [Thermoanaerobaculia bacterium]